jgi:cyclopropane fatty-acyl-phospholipid synthase-like methyltransferase
VPKLAFQRAPSEYDDAFMDKMAGEYLDQTRWTRLRLSALLPLVDPQPGDRILDLGCAAGALTHFFSERGATVIGIDSEPKAIEKARALFPDLEFEQADVSHLPQLDHSIDKAVAGDLVEHLDEPTLNAMLRELRRVLVPDGTLSIYTPNPKHVIERLKARDFVLAQNPTHIGLRTADQLVAALLRNGFTIEHVGWIPSFFPVLRVIERAVGRFSETFRYRLCIRASS